MPSTSTIRTVQSGGVCKNHLASAVFSSGAIGLRHNHIANKRADMNNLIRSLFFSDEKLSEVMGRVAMSCDSIESLAAE